MPGRQTIAACALAFGMLLSAAVGAETLGLDSRLDAAIAVYRQDGARKALPLFEQLAQKLSQAGKLHDETAAIHYIGECHWRLGNFAEAHRHLNHALALERSSGDRLAASKTLNVMGLLAWDQGDYELAKSHFLDAGAVARELGDRKLEGASLNNLSLVYDELGEYDISLDQYGKVLELYRGADFPRGVGDTLGNIGGVHLLLGRFQDALAYYQQALQISQALQSNASMSQDHGNVALCLLGLGRTDEAIKHFDQAIGLAQRAGMRQDEAYWMRQKGNGLMQKGRYEQGLTAHRAATRAYEQIGAIPELAEALHDMGRLHLVLGDPDSAELYFRRSLALARKSGLSRGVTQNLIALGDLQFRHKALDAATKLYQEAQQRSTRTGERQLRAQSLLHLAQVDRELQQYLPAAIKIGAALAIAREISARLLEAEALVALGDVQRRRGSLANAQQSFDAAENALQTTRDPDLLWRIDYGRAKIQEAHGQPRAAVDALLSAIRTIEGVRNSLQEPRFRSGFVDDKYEVYVDLVRLQLQLGRANDAFSTAERLRARSFTEQLAGRSSLPLTDADRQEEEQLLERIRQLQHALSSEDADGEPAYTQRAQGRFSHELQRAEQDYQAFIDDRARPSSAQPEIALSTTSVANVQRNLKDGEALLEYVVGPGTLMTFLLTRKSVATHVTPLRAADLNARISLLRDLAQRAGDERWRKPAQRLSSDLLSLLDDAVRGENIQKLYVIPHGVLNYLPFALLPFGDVESGTLLIDRLSLAYLPAAAVLSTGRPASTARGGLLALAPASSRLRYAPDEARSINALFAPNSRLLLGAQATESEFKRSASSFGMLHLATHGTFNKVNPLLSGLELEADASNDGALQVHEVLGLRLNASLVTLSACETGLGSGYFSETPAGDDFVGMTRAFLAAGSDTVVATLWEVDDRASGRLMQQFYGRVSRADNAESTADSLVFAQRELHAGKDYAHPYYWAPFVAVGAMNRALTGPQSVASSAAR